MKPALKQALIASAITIVYSMILYVTDLTRSDYEPWYRTVGFVVLIVFMVIAMRDQKRLESGFISYGKAFTTGLIYFIVASFIITIFSYLYFTVIDPTIVQFMADKQREKMESAGTMSEEQIDQAMHIAEKFMSPTVMCLFSFFGNIIIGTILSLIAAAFIKKERDPFDEVTPAVQPEN